MKRTILLLILGTALKVNGQQYSLYATKTLFDAFENPARKVYTQDTSRKFSFNFFLPNSSTNFIAAGSAQSTIRKIFRLGVYSGRDLVLGENKVTNVQLNHNTYLFMFRLYSSVIKHGEIGLSWQVRSDTRAKITNETIAVFDNTALFTGLSYSDLFNNRGTFQNYHQFGLSYRENITRQLGVGAKLSYLSGIAYNKLNIRSSSFTVDPATEVSELFINGTLKSSYNFNDTVKTDILIPGFKNPGIALSAGATYKLKYGWNISGQLKDIGFIRWNKKSVSYSVNNTITMGGTGTNDPDRLGNKLDSITQENYKTTRLTTFLNGKAEVLISKDYEHYHPALLVSKNTLDLHGDIGLLNNFSFGFFNFGLSTVYNTVGAMQVGGMGMIKTRIVEAFIGTDQVFKSYKLAKGITNSDNEIGTGNEYTGASVYFGLAFNFGPIMYHPMNSNKIRGRLR